MADLQSSHQDLFTAIQAVWTGDANALGGGTVSRGVRDMVREGDPRDDLSSAYITVQIVSSPDDGFETNIDRLTVAFTIHTRFDTTFNDQDVIAHQLRLKYHRLKTLTDGSNWNFGTMFIGRGYQAAPKDNYNRYVQTFEVTATKE